MSDASASGKGPYDNVYRLTLVTDTDHAAWLWISGILSLLYPIISSIIRIHVKRQNYGWDDWVLVGSTFVCACQHIALFVALAKGLGKTNERIAMMGNEAILDHAMLAAEIMYIFVMTGAKLSLALFIKRIFDFSSKSYTVICNGLIASTIAWGLSALVILFSGCPFNILANQCSGDSTRWWIVTALDIATELLLLAVPTALVCKIMEGIRPRMLVCAAFASRLPLIALTILHSIRIDTADTSPDRAFAYVHVIGVVQILVCWSLISASIPCSKAFLNPVAIVRHEGKGVNGRLGGETTRPRFLLARQKEPV